MTDLLLSAVMLKGHDPHRSARKVGADCPVGGLSAEQLAEYVRPFTETAGRQSGEAVLLHDGLPDGFSSPNVRLEFLSPALEGNNYERRFVAYRDYLAARPDVGRVWMVDVNDVAFTCDPWAWWDGLNIPPEAVLVGEEHHPYATNPWFLERFPHLPDDYREEILYRSGHRLALNCGAWAAHRGTALSVLTAMLHEYGRLRDFMALDPPKHPITTDMFTFARVLLRDHDNRLIPFRMDGRTPGSGVTAAPSPLVHDRQEALAALGLPSWRA